MATTAANPGSGESTGNVIAYSLTVPFMYALVWFCTFGGAAIRMHRRAEFLSLVGLELHNNTDHFLYTATNFRPAGAGKCFDVPSSLPGRYAEEGAYVSNAFLTPVCAFSYSDDAGYWFDLMNQYHGMGPFLSGLSILVIVLFFVTSSDSGSLVVDLIAANGREAHVVQRVFWALSEGAVAVALLQAGGQESLKALQAISIVAGLPFTIILMFMCTALWRAVKIDQGHMLHRESRTDWSLPLYGGIFDLCETVLTFGRSGLPEASSIVDFFLGLFAPPLLLWKALRGMAEKQRCLDDGQQAAKTSTPMQDGFLVVALGLTYFAFWLLHILALAGVNRGLNGMAWAALAGFASILSACRHSVRRFYRIEGGGPEDFFVSIFLWPQVLAQMAKQATLDVKGVPQQEAAPKGTVDVKV